jgi:transcriptional regulator with XRE-family HTH domain
MTESKKKPEEQAHRESTGRLLSRLFSTKSFATFMKRCKDALLAPSLPEYLTGLCESRGILRRELCRRVEIDRAFEYQIFSGKRRPPRDYLLKFALGLGLSVDECQRMLAIAKRGALYPRIQRDAAILHCLHKKLTYHETQELLFDNGMSILGEGS